MKKSAYFLLLFLLVCVPCLAAESTLLFCENFDERWEPAKPGAEFQGTTVSWIAASSESYGIPQIIVSVYRHEGAEEALVLRKTVDINPEWTSVGIRNMAFPQEGEYTVSLTTPAGKTLCKGRVRLAKAEKAAPPSKEETLGIKMRALFNRYAPK